MTDRCRCGATKADRDKTDVCFIPGCPYPAIAKRAPRTTERDLRHDADPARFGVAVLKCEGYTPDCSYLGRCQLRGLCFAQPGHLVAARMIERTLPSDGRCGTHYAYIRRVAQMLREGQIDL
jgi:hypothetical protein